ncbi:MAG TPA: ABC transporter ATP-binding protein, partial [Hydrogenophaga sp.]|uniref:ABC transporter ATP-binding protein n=1 Tax=Hydrogenophaga sp. TaxID=1904254 RepID=UPI002C8EECDB
MSLLQVKNLVVEFPTRRGTLRALDDISFDIAPGEILGVVGESGAGKSLTGASIIGLLEPPGRIASGQVLLEGQRIDNLPHEKMRRVRGRKIGAIFQDPLTSLNPLYSVGRQLTETITTHLPVSAAEARDRAIQLLRDTGIPAAEQRIDNLPYDAMRRVRGRRIGAIFQDPLTSLNPLYTVGRQLIETIQTHLPLNHGEARQRAIQLLKDTGIPAAEARVDHYPHQFSGGMRQRVVIALALAAEPQLIVADEPTTALDVSIQAQIISLLKRLCKEKGAAVMLVTHDMGVIAETCDRVAVMYAGRIVEIGPVREVVK